MMNLTDTALLRRINRLQRDLASARDPLEARWHLDLALIVAESRGVIPQVRRPGARSGRP